MKAQFGQILFYSLGFVLLAAACLISSRKRGMSLCARLVGARQLLLKRKVALQALAASEERYRALFSSISEGFALHEIILDQNGAPCDYRFLDVNPAFELQTGIPRERWVGHTVREILPDTEQEWIDAYGRVALTGETIRFENYSGALDRYYSVAAFSPTPGQFAVLASDITERKRAEWQIRLHSAALNAADDLVAIMDAEGRIVFANDAFKRQSGSHGADIVGSDLSDFWPETPSGVSLAQVWESIGSGNAWAGEMSGKSKDGRSYTADVSITPLASDDERALHWVAIARNITDRKVQEGLLDYQAHHDALTDLPNRVRFSEELGAALADRRERRQQCAVLFVDLDRFKIVNDTMGHHAGDCLLVEVALRLGSCLRAGDILARIGGDEFTALLKNIKSPQDAGAVANRMLQQMSTPFDIRGNKLVIGASIGVSIFPDNATDVEGLIKCADAAMYRAKELGRNNRQFYSKELNETNQARVDMENDLRMAMQRDELKVYYQPIVEAKTMRLVGAEALLRWDHPEKGAISPGIFVPIAEDTGMIVDIGKTVLHTACRQAKAWRDQGHGDFEMSINVSPVQLRDSNFAQQVLNALSETGLSAGCLNLEVIESTLDKNDYGEMETLGGLKAAGVNVCLDDFGLGYSSLSGLKDLPIVSMKVDGSFIKEIGRSPKDRAITESIISMAHSLGIKVTAEWIESDEQMETIRLLGCDYAQGYFISPALTAEAFEDFAEQWRQRGRRAA